MHLLSQLTSSSTREGTKDGRTVGVVTAIEEQLVNSRAPEDSNLFPHRYLCAALAFIAAVYASAFGVGPLGTNPRSCNQTCLDSGNSQ